MSDQTTSKAVGRIKEIVGPAGWIAPDEAAAYTTDWRGEIRGATQLVVRPGSIDEICEVVRVCGAAGLSIVPQGGNTGMVAGATPAGNAQNVILSLGRLNRVRQIDADNYSVTVEAGCVLQNLQNEVLNADRYFPLSFGAEGSCQIGGAISTNAGGVGVLRYGNTRDLVLGLEVVLPDGGLLSDLSGLRKNNEGYDWKQFFIGAEGTLGIVTAATLKIFPRPTQFETCFLALSDLSKLNECFSRARNEFGELISAFELIPRIAVDMSVQHVPNVRTPIASGAEWCVLLEVSATSDSGLRQRLENWLGQALELGLIGDAVIALSGEQARNMWNVRHGIPEGLKVQGKAARHDISVKISEVAGFIRKMSSELERRFAGVRVVAFGHVGDGNVHYIVCAPIGSNHADFEAQIPQISRVVHDEVKRLGGSITAEHGIGLTRRDDFLKYVPPYELQFLHKLKKAIDPNGIFNPNKVI